MQKNRKNKKLFVVLFGVLLVLIVIAFGLGRKETTDSKGESKVPKEEETISFPYSLEKGKLIINSLFQASVQNPDCNDEIGEDIASLEIINKSEEYCEEAEINLEMQDGTKYKFKIFDIPAGKTLWAFELDNKSYTLDNACVKVKCKAVFDKESEISENIEYFVNDTAITIRNLTDVEMNKVSVYYHCLFEEAYYGGKSYCQTIESLPANGETSIEADECYMGAAEVVRIVEE